MKYRAEIDGLRAFAVVPVILFHAGFELFSGGFVGVDVFFVISGYLITSILIEDIEQKRFSIVDFYERRARRILPALYVVVLFTLALSTFLLFPLDLLSVGKSAFSIPVFSSNIYFWSERGYFGADNELKPLIHTWSLAVEEQFYIFFPIVLLLLSKFRKWILYSVLGLVFVVSLGASFSFTKMHFDAAFYLPFARAWELLIGSFCAIYLFRNTDSDAGLIAEILSVVGLALILGAYLSFDSTTIFPYITALIPTLGTALFIIASRNSTYMKKAFSWYPVVFVGLVSYSLYLWHQPIFALARHVDVFLDYRLILIIASLLAAILSFHYVEKPFRNKSRVTVRGVVCLAVIGSLIIFVFAGLIMLKKGLPSRFNIQDQALLTQLANNPNYNQRRFDALILKAFEDPQKKNIVLVGDSHARDFLNILLESGIFENYEFSTRQVKYECGNLLLEDYSIIAGFIPAAKRDRCEALGRFNGAQFQDIVGSADELWLVSSWLPWVVDYLPQSIANLEREFNKPVRVVGLKSFGEINAKFALRVPHDERPVFTQQVSRSHLDIADRMDLKLRDFERYYPVMDAMCGGERNGCRIFTQEGFLVSPDGGHLTREGAKESAERIRSTLLEMQR